MTKKEISKKSDAGLPAEVVDYFFPMKRDAEATIAKIAKVLCTGSRNYPPMPSDGDHYWYHVIETGRSSANNHYGR